MYNFLQEIKSDQNLFHSLNPQSIEHSVSDRTAISVSGSRLKAVFGHLYPFENLSVSVWKLTILPGFQPEKPDSDYLFSRSSFVFPVCFLVFGAVVSL